MKLPFGHTIFCDDIRDEVANKKTFVGVYQNEMVVPGPFPILLPIFCLSISYFEPIEWPVQLIQIKVFGPGEHGDEIIVDADISADRPSIPQGLTGDLTGKLRAHHMHFKLSPLVIFHEGAIRVRAYMGDQEVKLGALSIRLAKEAERAKFGWHSVEPEVG